MLYIKAKTEVVLGAKAKTRVGLKVKVKVVGLKIVEYNLMGNVVFILLMIVLLGVKILFDLLGAANLQKRFF